MSDKGFCWCLPLWRWPGLRNFVAICGSIPCIVSPFPCLSSGVWHGVFRSVVSGGTGLRSRRLCACTGPVTLPESPHRRVIEWDQPVTVRIACDLQDWMLFEVKSSQANGRTARSLWSWVRGKESAPAWELETPVATAHRLRALLYRMNGVVSDSDALVNESPISQASHRSLASSAVGKISGSTLVRSVLKRSRTGKPSGVAHQNEHAQPWSSYRVPSNAMA